MADIIGRQPFTALPNWIIRKRAEDAKWHFSTRRMLLPAEWKDSHWKKRKDGVPAVRTTARIRLQAGWQYWKGGTQSESSAQQTVAKSY